MPSGKTGEEGNDEGLPLPKSAATLSVAVDIGGTFTDITLADAATGQSWRAKVPSTPADPSEAFMAGVRVALDAAGASPPPSAACCTAPRSPPT